MISRKRRIRYLVLVIAAALIVSAWSLLFWTPELTGHSLVTIIKTTTPEANGSEPYRFRIGLIRNGDDRIRFLTESFWTASSPAPSFDGRRFLFRGRKAKAERPAIWEMRMNGRKARRVTSGTTDPDNPLYLPNGAILFSDTPPDPTGKVSIVRSLFSWAPNDTDRDRITFGNYHDDRPELLPDGRIRFLRRMVSPGGVGKPVSMTIHPDGTGLARFLPSPAIDSVTSSPPPPVLREDLRIEEVVDASASRPPAALTSVVDEKKKTGTLLCINAYLSDLDGIIGLSPGDIRKVRVSQAGSTGIDSMGRPTPSPVLAEGKVYRDGSFFVEVPADTPLQLMLLGEDDRPLAVSNHGIWVRPNENRGCIGCHENRELAPENRMPLALQRGPNGEKSPEGNRAR